MAKDVAAQAGLQTQFAKGSVGDGISPSSWGLPHGRCGSDRRADRPRPDGSVNEWESSAARLDDRRSVTSASALDSRRKRVARRVAARDGADTSDSRARAGDASLFFIFVWAISMTSCSFNLCCTLVGN